MKISEWLSENTKILKASNIGTARLDCLVLLKDALGKDRAFLLARPETIINSNQLHRLNLQIKQRQNHTPLAYIRGKVEFYGREYIVNKDVLVPRPESETMIELLLARADIQDAPLIIDIGTGSGALAITAKLELPLAKVIASDIDPKCLTIASKNAQKHSVDIELVQGDILEPFLRLNHSNIFILANLPYVPDSYKINQAATMEPRTAIFGGPDGSDLYKQLFNEANEMLYKPKCIFTESLPPQHDNLTGIAKRSGYSLVDTIDFIQVFELTN